jgi:hypothetical protein
MRGSFGSLIDRHCAQLLGDLGFRRSSVAPHLFERTVDGVLQRVDLSAKGLSRHSTDGCPRKVRDDEMCRSRRLKAESTNGNRTGEDNGDAHHKRQVWGGR